MIKVWSRRKVPASSGEEETFEVAPAMMPVGCACHGRQTVKVADILGDLSVAKSRSGEIPWKDVRLDELYTRASYDESFRLYLRDLQAASREELSRADTKAQIILAIVGIGSSAILGGLFARSWTPARLPNSIEWLWWVGAALSIVAIAQLAYTVYPRSNPVGRDASWPVSYFADVDKFASITELTGRLIGQPQPELDRLVDQIYSLSCIVSAQYRGIKRGIALSWLAGMAFAFAAVLSSVVS